MVTRWHLLHLPVWVAEERRPWRRVQEVLLIWSEGRAAGVVLEHWWPEVLFVPAGEGLAIRPTGVWLAHRSLAVRRPRAWFREQAKSAAQWLGRPVVDGAGQEVGRLKDVVIDEETWTVAGAVISRGLLRDLLDGAWVVDWREFQGSGGLRMK
ncbi:MAG: PRC-barrel domain-containing protein [Firmicutes bacterium]|nr:PRC-barrel domain-containing protein [Alicyclobacillaceae bacterium]MCL6496626.1 PRC-barrel domain-containing protein [Bacillota bacterium]